MKSFLPTLRASLVNRLVAVLLLSSLALTVAMTLLRWREDRAARSRSLEEYVRALERDQVPTLVSSLWTMDIDHVHLQLAGYLNIPFLAYGAVEKDGKPLAWAGSLPAGPVLERTFPLAHDHGGQTDSLGVLRLVFDQGRIDRELAKGFAQRLLSQGGIVFFIVALTLFLSRRMFTIRLARLSGAAAGVRSDRLAEDPASLRNVLPLPSGNNDELDQVVAAMRNMGAELERAFEAQRTNQERLRKSEEMITSILDNVDEGFIVLDRDLRIKIASRAYCRQVGRTLEEVIGKHCYAVSHHSDRPCVERGEQCVALEAFATGRPAVAVHDHETGDGRVLHVETRSFPLRDAGGHVASVIEVLNDTTERVKLEEQLRQAQKLEAIGLLAGGVAHDFNNILMAIVGYASLVNIKLPPGDPLRPSVDQILFAADRAANLTASLLAFGRKQLINPRPLDLNEVLAQIGKLLWRVIGEDIDLKIHPGPGPLVVFADRVQLEQVFLNLATNARDAMAAGGALVISTFSVDGARVPKEKRTDAPVGPYAVLTVSDTGVGMDARTRERIFEPFFTTKGLGRGTGLGLATVYGVITQNKGFINVYSEPGQGTTFKIYLPLLSGQAPPAPREQRIEMRRGTETILLAEDDPVVRGLIAEILREAGYTVIQAVDGEESVRIFAEHQDAIDLALLDVIMPKCDGRKVRDAIRLLKPSVRVLFLSGYAADLLAEKGLVEPGLSLVSKPMVPQVLLEKVREALDREPRAAG